MSLTNWQGFSHLPSWALGQRWGTIGCQRQTPLPHPSPDPRVCAVYKAHPDPGGSH